MNTQIEEIHERLEAIAYKLSIPFSRGAALSKPTLRRVCDDSHAITISQTMSGTIFVISALSVIIWFTPGWSPDGQQPPEIDRNHPHLPEVKKRFKLS